MDKEKRQMEEAIANSLVDQKRLEGEREKQRLEFVLSKNGQLKLVEVRIIVLPYMIW